MMRGKSLLGTIEAITWTALVVTASSMTAGPGANAALSATGMSLLFDVYIMFASPFRCNC